LNLILNQVLGLTGELVALTTAISMTVGALVTLLVLFRGRGMLNYIEVGKALLASLIMAGGAYPLTKLFVSMEDGKLLLIAKCGGIGIVAMALFLLVSFLLHLEAITGLFRKKK